MSTAKRVLISPLSAVSTVNQAELIKKLLTEKGFKVEMKSFITVLDTRDEKYYAFLWLTLASHRFLGNAVAPYLLSRKPKALYVTIEGVPSKSNVICSALPRLAFIANSDFTKKCLEHIGLKVIDVIHHAVDYERCELNKERSMSIRKKWDEQFGNRTRILYVGRNDPRKGLDRTSSALNLLPQDVRNNFVLLLFSDGNLSSLTKYTNVINIGSFGSVTFDQVLQMMGAADYLIFPSVSEGFGLPVLEANAMGTPVIHSWFPPLSEFSSKDFNFVFGYQYDALVNNANVQFWIFHEYRPQLLAEMIGHAVKVHRESRSEYDEYCSKALDHAKAWDYKAIYPRLLRHMGIE